MQRENVDRLAIGCPVWACSDWVGSLYASNARQTWLTDYSQVFNAVEGNSTFYALPTQETFENWVEQAGEGFRFSFKFPGEITHQQMLVGAERETEEFLLRLEVVQSGNRLGSTFLQLPPFFSGEHLRALKNYLQRLPRDMPFAVEARHPDYFDSGTYEQQFDQLLAELGMDRVLFDSRALFSRSASDPSEVKSQSRKPKSPYRTTVTAGSPMVRFVGRNDVTLAKPWIRQWGTVIGEWLAQGLSPTVFTHSPDDSFAPHFATMLHEEIRKNYPPLQPLSPWPGTKVPTQQDLFELG